MIHDQVSIIRRRYSDGIIPNTSVANWAETWLKILLAQDGSATLLCETIGGDAVTLEVVIQRTTRDVPHDVHKHLIGDEFIERQVCISVGNEVMMDNLTYISLEQIDPEVLRLLEDKKSPIGYIFDKKQTRKKPVENSEEMLSRLWERSGIPDPDAARSYVLEIQKNPCMLITETFRSGMRHGLPEA